MRLCWKRITSCLSSLRAPRRSRGRYRAIVTSQTEMADQERTSEDSWMDQSQSSSLSEFEDAEKGEDEGRRRSPLGRTVDEAVSLRNAHNLGETFWKHYRLSEQKRVTMTFDGVQFSNRGIALIPKPGFSGELRAGRITAIMGPR